TDLLRRAEAQAMAPASQETSIEERRNVDRRNRAISDTAARGLDLDHRLKPEHPARSVAHQAKLDVTPARLGRDRVGDLPRAQRERRGVPWDVDRRSHRGRSL